MMRSPQGGLSAGMDRKGSPPPEWGCPPGCPRPPARAVALLRVAPTQSSGTGKVWGLRWHNLPREGKGK